MGKKKQREMMLQELQNDLSIASKEEKAIKPKTESAEPKPLRKYSTINWYIPGEKVRKELKQLALDEDKKLSDLITEGVDLLLKSRGKPTTAELITE